MKILGIDPGSNTGYGVIACESNRLRRVDGGCIRTSGENWPERLSLIFDGVSQVVTEHQPDMVAIEQVFMAKNAQAALKIGHARGAAICACASNGVPVYEYAAREIKKAVTASGAAGKDQVQFMVQTILGLATPRPIDESDALACAITHFQHASAQQLADAAIGASRMRAEPHGANTGAVA